MDPRQDRTAIRLKLYSNGFVPLPNKNKMTLIKEWSTLKVTPELIQSRQWARSHAFLDTGIRCGEVVALDWDIDDPILLNALLDEVVDADLIEDCLFVRIGKAPRELWVFRTKDKIGKRTTGHFTPEGAPEDHTGFAVEILGAGCQFAAFGQRDEHTAYTWPEQSLLDHKYMDLPEINLKQVDALKDFCVAFFERNGLTRRSPAGGTDAGYTHAFDLTEDMVFNVKDLGEVTVAELVQILTTNPDEVLRCSVETFRPTSGSWAGMASMVDGVLCISDHGTYTSHFLEAEESGLDMSALGSLLAERFPEAVKPAPENLDIHPDDPFDDNLAKALKRFVQVKDGGLICDPKEDFQTYTTAVFRDNFANYWTVKQGPKGGEIKTLLTEMWRENPGRITVKDIQMRPDQSERIFVNDASLHLNTYSPPEFPPGGDPTGGLDLIERMLPNADERRHFMQWLSFKFQNPSVPGSAIVMVARDTYGTGRGTLIKLMAKLFGERYVKNVDFATLTGAGYQAQYNEWMINSLIVAVDEAAEAQPNVTRWQSRSNAYEHLKTIVDPAARSIYIKRKGMSNTEGRTYASVFVASNHGDALVIPPNDRRFAILENGASMPPTYWLDFNRWMDSKANVGAFGRALLDVDLATYNPYVAPPMTAAKADMIDAGTSELDKATAVVFARAAGRLMVREQYLLLVEATMLEMGSDFPEEWQKAAERIFPKKTRRLLGPDRYAIDGKVRTIRMVGACEAEVLQSTERMIEEVLKNGPLTRTIQASGKVVSFGGSRKSL
jgi:hypothetical protein